MAPIHAKESYVRRSGIERRKHVRLRFSVSIPAVLALCGRAEAQTPIHVLHGGSEGDRFGGTVAGIGDANGDGLRDVVVGAYLDDPNGYASGSAFVISGADGSILHSLHGQQAGQAFGRLVAAAGDVDLDGHADFIVCSVDGPNGPSSGSVRLYSGADGRLIHQFDGHYPTQHFGFAVSNAGDVDGDGRPDLLVGANGDDTTDTDAGAAWIYSGADGSVLRSFYGSSYQESFGFAVAGVGDIDGDGRSDVAVGAPYFDSGFGTDSGRVWIYSGADGSVLWFFDGYTPNAALGQTVAPAGDVDRDGYPDVIVGAPREHTFVTFGGNARVHSGRDGSVLRDWYGFVAYERLGSYVAGMGDVDGDGWVDLGVSSGTDDTTGTSVIHVYSGLDGTVLHSFDTQGGEWTYARVCGPGDVNGDGYADLLIGAALSDQNGRDSGSAYVLSGHEHLLPYCFGDGGGAPCPCINRGGPGEGCANSGGAGGLLSATGSASLVDDELAFAAAQLLPGQPALLFAGANAVNGGLGQPFGDGLRCAGGAVRRLGIRVPDGAGHASWGPGLSAPGGWSAGDAARFQVWYRDPVSPCDSNFNLTNGLEVIFSL